MFGNKEKRDYALLIFMALVVIIFMAYLFLPSGDKKNVADAIAATQNLPDINSGEPPHTERADDFFIAYNARIEGALAAFFQHLDNLESLPESPAPDDIESSLYDTQLLDKKGGDCGKLSEVLEKIKRLSVYNLKELLLLDFPKSFSKRFRYNVYTAALLQKVPAEHLSIRVNALSNQEMRDLLDFSFLDLIGNELEKDFQALPILLYFELLLKRLNIYTDPGQAAFFRENIEKVRDLSPRKLLLQIKEYLNYSEERTLFRLEWIENDDLDPDDVGVYQKLNVSCVHFLKQKYIVFPAQTEAENLWISELCNADSGDIELEGLSISSEDPGKSIRLDRILYTPDTSRFICVLTDDTPRPEPDINGTSQEDLLSRRVSSLVRNVEQHYKVIHFDPQTDEEGVEQRRRQLIDFGNYLKTTSFYTPAPTPMP